MDSSFVPLMATWLPSYCVKLATLIALVNIGLGLVYDALPVGATRLLELLGTVSY
jgi:hypothetical protein